MPTIPASCILALEAVLVLGLCSTLPRTAQAGTPPADACALFTASEVSRALGVAVANGQHPIASSLLLCGWVQSGESQIDGKKLSVSFMTERAFEVGKTAMQGAPKTPLSGVGDDAYYSTPGGLDTALSIKKGGTCVQIRVGGFPAQKQKELEKALALQLLAKL
jgi:hypothetical protein